MGSPPAPLLANSWLSKFDQTIKGDAKLFTKYMDDILRVIDRRSTNDKINEVNNIHPSLQFTVEREKNMSLPFLDMVIQRNGTKNFRQSCIQNQSIQGLL